MLRGPSRRGREGVSGEEREDIVVTEVDGELQQRKNGRAPPNHIFARFR